MLKIMLIDDNNADAFLLKTIIIDIKKDCDILILNNGQSAIDYFSNNDNKNPDLIILDFNMPGKNGLEVLNFIQESKHAQNVPIVLYSNSQNQEVIDAAYKLNASSYVIKSFDNAKAMVNFWINTNTFQTGV